MSTDRADWVGKTIGDGRFQILRKLGEGGMGFVYQAHDSVLETDVVIKVPRGSMLDDPEFKARFARENRALVRLQHPNIVSILFVGEAEGLPYAVMQYLPGGDLKDRQTAAGRGRIVPLPPSDLPTWLPGIAKALDFIHAQGFIHRDVKPANILFDGHGNVYLSDFGVAKVVSEKKTRAGTSLTGTGMVLGTPEYMAPELIMGESFDGQVDQYALAISVYEVLSGRTPFEGTKSESILVKQVTEAIPPLILANPKVSKSLSDCIMVGLAKNPKARYGTCTEFANAVLDVLKRGQATAKVAAPQTDDDIVEPVLLEPGPTRGHTTARVGQLKTAIHPALAPVALVEPVIAPVGKSRLPWGGMLVLWAGLTVVFGGFVSALAMMSAGQRDEPEVSRKLTEEEKMLAVPLATEHPERDYTNSLGMKMICFGPGRFLGANASATDWKKWDKLVEPCWMSDREVSVAQYFAFVNDQAGDKTPYYPQWLLADRPTFVDWESSPYHQSDSPIYQNGMPITGITSSQMRKFCEWLSDRPGEIMRYRLPTREEWVCAYRAGTETPYYWGENFQPGRCNTALGNKRPSLDATIALPANPWRLYHIAGNVAEVLSDGEHAAGGHWKTMQAEHHSASAILPLAEELWLYGFRVVAVPKAIPEE